MPPKKKFTREQIVDAAFEIAKEEGLEGITIRKIAQEMGSSIAPIYVNFADVDEVKEAVLGKIHDISQEMLNTTYSEDTFLNIGIASLKFAREYSVLFKDLVLNSKTLLDKVQPDPGSIFGRMQKSDRLKDFNQEELAEILFKMRVFQLGLSVMDVNGMLPGEMSDKELIGILERTGGDIIEAARLRKHWG
ncbi:TetR/AcrR family transcriptional regulator [Bacillus sp. B-jedd]|uniref:TetR/AcrR family transcriptional regulator n=1 Tax=Bacillus sp. B-jedd TaxID=1476857 RepID=UPI0005156FA3|nr:TetR/AcrR family transcriptional regulator [Bacillus sp. B-jedd]CEG25763.1 putative DNA-binding transcriptional regulator [Bacillus sp. B-jedd]